MDQPRPIAVILAVILCVAAISGAHGVEQAPASETKTALVSMSAAGKEDVKGLVDKDFQEFRSNARNWSFAYHLFLFGAAALSALAALVLKLEGAFDIKKRNNWGAALAAVSAMMVTIMTSGGFQRKWEANRLAAFEVRNLQLELHKSTATPDKILESLQRINAVRNEVIVGVSTSVTFEAAPGKKTGKNNQ